MCTVTFIPRGEDIFLSASRDERRERPNALPPEIHEVNGQKVLFPMDPLAGGTWMAVNENGNAVVLLNGALQKHIPQPPYRKSRGLIVLDLLSALSPSAWFDGADLQQIEPFTTVIAESGSLFVCRWNGSAKSRAPHRKNFPGIWSSVTLYDAATVEKRERWFTAWLSRNPDPTPEDIMDFHREAGEGDPHTDLLMNRNDQVFTQSISTVCISRNLARFQYFDLRRMAGTECFLPLAKSISVTS